MHLHAVGHRGRVACARACACARVRGNLYALAVPRQPCSSSSRPFYNEVAEKDTASTGLEQQRQHVAAFDAGGSGGDGRAGDDSRSRSSSSSVEGVIDDVQQGGVNQKQGFLYTRPHFVASTAPSAQSALADLKRRYNQHPIRLHPHNHDAQLGLLGSLGTAPVQQPPPSNKVMRRGPTPDCTLPHNNAENSSSGSGGGSSSSSVTDQASRGGDGRDATRKQRQAMPGAGQADDVAIRAVGGNAHGDSAGTRHGASTTGYRPGATHGHGSAGAVSGSLGHSDDDDDSRYADVLVALGGDGFLLSQLHTHVYSGLPVFGMNRGTLGFLLNEYLEELLLERLTAAVHRELHPLRMKTVNTRGEVAYALAFNEVSVFRQTRQAAQLRVSIDGTVRMNPLVSDGILVGTPAGSTAYNASAGGIMLPLDSGLLTLTPICAFRPRRLRGGVLHRRARVVLENLDADKRPLSATADFHEVRDVVRVEVEEARDIVLELLYDPSQDIDEKVWQEQFF